MQKYLGIISIDMGEILIDILRFIECMISFIELCEDDVEFSVFLRERESLDDEGTCIDDLSSSDECTCVIRDFDEFISFFWGECIGLFLWG